MDNRIKLSNKEINNILDKVKSKNKKHFIFIPRDYDTQKNPREYMAELGIDYNDAIQIIKKLSINNFVECILDKKNNYIYLYVFKDYIKDNMTYIKIGFLYDIKSGDVHVVSFHKDIIEEV